MLCDVVHLTMFRRNRENKAKLEHKLYLARENPEPTFDLSDCGIRNVPHGIYSLCRVFLKESLHLGGNCLSSLNGGGSLQDLSLLRILDLHNNAFSTIPDDIYLLSNLMELYLNNNQLKKLPSNICNLSQLQILDVSYNNLHKLPEDIGNLGALKKLNLIMNKNLNHLPKSICQSHRLVHIELDEENYVYPPSNIVKDGTEFIKKYICDDVGSAYIPPDQLEELPGLKKEDPLKEGCDGNKFQAKIWELEKIKEQKVIEFLEIERNNELLQRQEIELANALKTDKIKLLSYITEQQSKFDRKLVKIQQVRDCERFKLIEQLQEVEINADVAIRQLLAINNEPLVQLLEQEQEEEARLLAVANKYNENLRRNDILEAMQTLIAEETQQFKRFDEDRAEAARSILEQEIQADSRIAYALQNQNYGKNDLIAELQNDNHLQKAAVGALLERSDARSWGLVQQVRLVESKLAALTLIELDRRKLEMDEHVNDIAEKRINLSILLIELLEKQENRRAQLILTIKSLEESNNTVDDFWLKQYQSLLDRMPAGILNLQRNLDPNLADNLLMAGVIHCLPFLAKWSLKELKSLTEEDLCEAGINSSTDRQQILHAFDQYQPARKHFEAESPSAPAAEEASAPPVEFTNTFPCSECVVCLDYSCQIIFVPCGHFCCCTNCSSPLHECPLCRGLIERKIRVVSV